MKQFRMKNNLLLTFIALSVFRDKKNTTLYLNIARDINRIVKILVVANLKILMSGFSSA